MPAGQSRRPVTEPRIKRGMCEGSGNNMRGHELSQVEAHATQRKLPKLELDLEPNRCAREGCASCMCACSTPGTSHDKLS